MKKKCENCRTPFETEAIPKLVPLDGWWCAHCRSHFARKGRERAQDKYYAYACGVIMTDQEFMALVPIDPADQLR